jgi:hypothetical protein
MATELGKTLSALRTRVRRWIREEDSDKSRFSNALIQQVINTHFQLRASELHMAHEGFFTFQGTRNLVKDQSRYSWPSGFTRLLKLELVRSDGRRVPIWRDERHYGVLHPSEGSGQDQYRPNFRPVGNGFVLEPAPIETVVGGLFFEWNGVPAELTADGDTIPDDFPEMFIEMVVLDSAVALFDLEGVQESGQLTTILRLRNEWEQRWERYIDGRMVQSQSVTPFPTHYHDA